VLERKLAMHYLLTGALLLLLLMGQVARVAAACRGSLSAASLSARG
jgi:hypothetical protein